MPPRKGLRRLFSLSSLKQDSHQIHHRRRRQVHAAASATPSPSRQTFSDGVMEENIAAAAEVIAKWGPEVDASLFSGKGRGDAERFLRAAANLHCAMLFFSSLSADSAISHATRSSALLRAHSLLSATMRRLEREFHLLLSAHGHFLNPFDPLVSASSTSNISEVDDAADSIAEVESASDVAMADLRAVADAMISAGYGKECVRVYKMMRKSFVDESIHRLGCERLTQSQIQKLEWAALESKIRAWLAAAPVAFRTILSGERLLCDRIFAGCDAIRDSCFADVSRDSVAKILAFPESVARSKKSPEKLFRVLELYDAVTELWPNIESMFGFESAAAVRSQAVASLLRLAEAARSTLADFEAAIQRDASRSPVTSGDVHPLTRYVMNYLVFLANYDRALADVFSDFPFEAPSPLPDSSFDAATMAMPPASAPSSPSSTSTTTFEGSLRSSSHSAVAAGSISVRIAWQILVLICKLDVKAELYKEVALSYLFLANNIKYIVQRVEDSGLRSLLGDAWVAGHGAKARHYAASYGRLAWAKVTTAVADVSAELPAGGAMERMREFNVALEAACQGQSGWVVVADGELREQVRTAVTEMIVPVYRVFYEKCRAALRGSGDAMAPGVRLSPEDVENRLYGIFGGSTGSGSSKYSNRSRDSNRSE